MKGVVRPQARPTRRKPRVQLRIEGEEAGGVSVSVSDIVEVDWAYLMVVTGKRLGFARS